MDKRYLLILIIVIMCFISLFVISNNSDNIGSASVACGKYCLQIPNGFSLYDSGRDNVHIYNGDSGININVYSNLRKNDTFKNRFDLLSNTSDFHILSNGSIDVNGIKVDSVYYEDTVTNQNKSHHYFSKENNSFRIFVYDFNYNQDLNKTLDYVSIIAQSIKVDYKK